MKKGLEKEEWDTWCKNEEDIATVKARVGRDSGARPETEARAGATGSDLVILPSNLSSPSAPHCLSPSTLFVHPAINPEL